MAGAGYKNFQAAEVLIDTDVDTYLMEQSVMVFATAAARDSALTAPSEGMVAYLSDSNFLCQYSGTAWSGIGPTSGAWRSWTPNLTNFTQGNGTVTARYMRVGRMVRYKFLFTLGSTSTVSTNPIFSLPVTAASQDELDGNHCRLLDSSPFTRYGGWAVGATTSTIQIGYTIPTLDSYLYYGEVAATSPFTWATGDKMFVSGAYEASSDAVV